ncbi:MAG: histidine kinase N-terminal 7TM domain-containing protein, partial [Clostridiales bacterium]
MISNLDAGIFIVTLIVISIFIIGSIKKGNMDLLNKVYIFISIAFICWILPLLMMKFVSVDNIKMLYVLDSLTYIGVCFAPLGYLCLAIVFVKGFEKMPKWIWLLFVFPIIINLVVWTNPWHHLQYQVFSVIKSEIVFGPFLYVSGAYNYLCLVGGIFLMISFAVKNATTLYLKQCLLVAFGGLIPLFVNSLATFTTLNMSITATPISFIPTIVFNGIAIYQLHILDIKPIITRHILDRIADCYVVLNEDGLVMNYNNPFDDIFASRYGIKENGYLKDCVKNEDISLKTPLYNILTSVDACRQSGSIISYEQAVTINVDGNARKNYYITDVSPLFIQGKIAGFVVTFKDISQLKKSMEQLQDSQRRMM